MRRDWSIFVACAISLPLSASAYADFVNPSFESPNIGSATIQTVGGSDVVGWQMSAAGSLISNGFDGVGTGVTWHNTPDGNQYLYVADNVLDGSVSQAIDVTAGDHTLLFLQADFGSQFSLIGGKILVTITRQSDNQVILSDWNFTTPALSDFTRQSMLFTAPTSDSYMFTFATVAGNAGIIDSVHLDAVPEPASLLVLGLGTLCLARRRRRSQG